MSPVEPTANPGEPNHERIASPPSGSAEPAAGWRPREPPLIIVDPAFVLDRWRPTDSAALRRMDLDSDTARFFGYTVEQAQAMPDSHYDGDERARGNLRAWHAGRELNLAIRRRSDSEAAGWVELRLAGDEAEVSYNVTAELRRQGIASRALQAFLTWAEQQIGLRRAHLACHIGNLASRRVAEKCGFVLLSQQGEEYRFRRDLDPARRHATGTVSLSLRHGHRLLRCPRTQWTPRTVCGRWRPKPCCGRRTGRCSPCRWA
jgi:RimJ/RimL family protein N-acetyltransferase